MAGGGIGSSGRRPGALLPPRSSGRPWLSLRTTTILLFAGRLPGATARVSVEVLGQGSLIRAEPSQRARAARKGAAAAIEVAPAAETVEAVDRGAKLAAGPCPLSHPWAYRPDDDYDRCCATGDNCRGTHSKGRNSLARRSERSECCANHAFVKCPHLRCSDAKGADHAVVLTIGASRGHMHCKEIKEVASLAHVVCPPNSGQQGVRVNRAGHQERIARFSIAVDDTRVCARRRDKERGWAMNLQVQCYLVLKKHDRTKNYDAILGHAKKLLEGSSKQSTDLDESEAAEAESTHPVRWSPEESKEKLMEARAQEEEEEEGKTDASTTQPVSMRSCSRRRRWGFCPEWIATSTTTKAA